MQELFNQKRTLKGRIDELLKSRTYTEKGELVEVYDEVSPLLARIKELDSSIESNRRELAHLLESILAELELLAREGRIQQIADLIGSARNLACLLYEERNFNLQELKGNLAKYQSMYRERATVAQSDFVALLEKGFPIEP